MVPPVRLELTTPALRKRGTTVRCVLLGLRWPEIIGYSIHHFHEKPLRVAPLAVRVAVKQTPGSPPQWPSRDCVIPTL